MKSPMMLLLLPPPLLPFKACGGATPALEGVSGAPLWLGEPMLEAARQTSRKLRIYRLEAKSWQHVQATGLLPCCCTPTICVIELWVSPACSHPAGPGLTASLTQPASPPASSVSTSSISGSHLLLAVCMSKNCDGL